MDTTLLDNYIAAWNSGDVNQLMPLFDENVDYQDIALGKSLDYKKLEEFVTSSFANNKVMRFEKISECITANCIAWEWRMIIERKTGEKINVPGMSMTEFENGKVIRNRDYWSTVPTPN